MHAPRHTAETLWQIYLALPTEEKKTILRKFTVENDLFEEMIDSEILKNRKDKPTFATEKYLGKQQKSKSDPLG